MLQIESLDQRIALDATASAAAALPWFDAGELTYSFAPDGTMMGSERSTLFTELSSAGSVQQWQGEFAKAFDQWFHILGTSIAVHSDSGAPFGTFGPTQGDARFGDIRIGAVPLAGNIMAEAIPHSIITQGSWAGDILLNSNADWSNLQQLYSVALHEMGHVLGLPHSADPQSPMYLHGVHDALTPTPSDAAQLQKLYAGVDLHVDHDKSASREAHTGQWREEPNFQFEVSQAIPLEAALSASARYAASGELTTEATSRLYQLQPLGDIDHAEFLNIVVLAKQQNGLIPNVVLYDKSGDRIPSKILHNSDGVLVIQARDVEPNQTYYIAVTPAATAAQYQVGEFDLFAEYSLAALIPTEIGAYSLTADQPIVEQKFTVSTSRLIHVLVSSTSLQPKSANSAVWGTLVDSQNHVVAQLAFNLGDSRSAPLVFLEPGDYKLILQTGTQDGSRPTATSLKVYIDEISIDIGIGVVDPATEPIVTCPATGGNNPTCSDPTPIIVVEGPVFPDPRYLPSSPIYPSIPPWHNPPWFFWPIQTPTNPTYRHNPSNSLDVSGDTFVTPLDALLIVNELNALSPTGSTAFLDTNGDGLLTPIDVLFVVNALNALSTGNGEGPAGTSEVIATDTTASRAGQCVDDAISPFWDWELERKRKV